MNHRQAFEEVRERFAERVVGTRPDRAGQGLEPFRTVREDQAVRCTGGVREDLSYRRVRIGAVGFELPDAVVEGQASFFDAAQHQRGREQLRQPVQMERRVSPGGNEPLDVLPAKRLLPDDVVGPDDRDSEARDTRLDAERFDIVAQAPQHRDLCLYRHPDKQHHGNRQDQQRTAHEMAATVWKAPGDHSGFSPAAAEFGQPHPAAAVVYSSSLAR